MTNILLSIQPKPVCDILNGEKKFFEDKHAFKTGDVIWVYCTKQSQKLHLFTWMDEFVGVHFEKGLKDLGTDYCHAYNCMINGLVVAKFVVGEVIKQDSRLGNPKLYIASCLSDTEVARYGKGKPLYFHEITQLEIFEKPKELGEFYKMPSKNEWNFHTPITHAPKSFIYIEVLNAD